MKKIVQQISQGKFKIRTEGVENSELLLDFNPVINEFSLKGKYYLVHWQARPKGHRQWGIYSSKDGSYKSVHKPPKAFGSMEYLMLDDTLDNSIPSAVVLFKGSFIV